MTAAVRAGLLDTERGGGLVFRHDLIRQAVYADLTEHTRRALHQRCVRYLGEVEGDPLTIAVHARAGLGSGDEAGAALLADAAGRAAGSMPEVASELVLAAFHAVRPNQASWPELGRRCVELLGLVQRCAEAIEVADLLLAHLDDDESAGRVEVALARVLWLTGRWHASVERSTKALARPDVSPVLRARLRALQALALSRVEPAADAVLTAERALSMSTTTARACSPGMRWRRRTGTGVTTSGRYVTSGRCGRSPARRTSPRRSRGCSTSTGSATPR
jgi:hypothetical protein